MSEYGQDIVVVGAGVIGCSVAWELARLGAQVTLLDSATAVRAATWASAGMLLPVTESRMGGPFLDLALDSMRLWPETADALLDFTGIDIEHRRTPMLVVACDAHESGELDARYAWQRADGFDVERLTAADVRALEPGLGHVVQDALLDRSAAQVNNRLLGTALLAAARAAGVRVVEDNPALELLRTPDGAVSGVRTRDGLQHGAAAVVLAAGAWSDGIEGLPRRIPVFPVRGQMFALDAAPPPVTHLVMGPRCYLVPRAGTQMLVGATIERAGFDASTTPAGLHALLDALLELLPGAADLPVLETWAGLRPGSPDELPILGPDPDVAGLFYATGHYRNGILLTPITARALADLIITGACSADLAPFSVARFERT